MEGLEKIKEYLREEHGEDIDIDVLAPEGEDEIKVIAYDNETGDFLGEVILKEVD